MATIVIRDRAATDIASSEIVNCAGFGVPASAADCSLTETVTSPASIFVYFVPDDALVGFRILGCRPPAPQPADRHTRIGMRT